MANQCAKTDLAGGKTAWIFWGLPAGVLILGACVGRTWRTALWTPAFLVMGAACVYNAAHCGRVHCYITGPLFLVAALATLLTGAGVALLGWGWIGFGVVIRTALAYVPERTRGKYVATAPAGSAAP